MSIYQYMSLYKEKQSNTTKTLYLIRHAQGYHNLYGENSNCTGKCLLGSECVYQKDFLLDASLTEYGKNYTHSQSEKYNLNPDIVFSSPLTRALQTSSILFPGVDIIADENLHEQVGVHKCDIRRNKNILEKEYPDVDFTNIGDKDPFNPYERESIASIQNRCLEIYNKVKNSPYEKIALVSHSLYLQTFLSLFIETELTNWLQPCEIRLYYL